jgi:hypothetical protein
MKYLSSSLFALLLSALLFNACAVSKVKSNSKPITHELWDTLVKIHVSPVGKVNYKGIIQDSLKLNAYLELLSANHPNDKNWSADERLAYWINAYNAFTVKLIVDHYPTESIKDIKKGIPFLNDVWEINFFEIEGKSYNLNDLEHGIIRKRFADPRIHAACNCASFSCPKLSNEAFTAKRLDEQLDNQMRGFINNKTKNQLDADNPKMSKIFKWYAGDFKKTGKSVRDYINQYAEVKINEGADIDYLDYIWTLNE